MNQSDKIVILTYTKTVPIYTEYTHKISLEKFNEYLPEYTRDLVNRGKTGDAIGHHLYFHAHLYTIRPL